MNSGEGGAEDARLPITNTLQLVSYARSSTCGVRRARDAPLVSEQQTNPRTWNTAEKGRVFHHKGPQLLSSRKLTEKRTRSQSLS